MSGDAPRENFRFQIIIVSVGVFLMAVKFSAYYITGSVAILTDAMESIVNVAAGLIGLFALYLSAQPPDRSHPYGHGRVEMISASVEGTLITVAGCLIIFEAVDNLLNPKPISYLDTGLLLVAFAAIVNYVVGRAAISKGRKNRSPALEASGRHLCTDTYSSVGIIGGLMIVFAAMHFGIDVWWMDPALAMLFGGLILLTGLRVVVKALNGIMDKADEEMLSQIVDCLNEHRSERWIDVHNLRAINYGSSLYVELHVTLPPFMTVAEEETEKRAIMEAVRSKMGDSVTLILSPEPCRGNNCCHCLNECGMREEEFRDLLVFTVDDLIKSEQIRCGSGECVDREE